MSGSEVFFLKKNKVEREKGAPKACIRLTLTDYERDTPENSHFLNARNIGCNNPFVVINKIYDVDARKIEYMQKQSKGAAEAKDLIISINPFYYGLMKLRKGTTHGWQNFVQDQTFLKSAYKVLNPGAAVVLIASTSLYLQYAFYSYGFSYVNFEKKYSSMDSKHLKKSKIIKNLKLSAVVEKNFPRLSYSNPRSINRYASPSFKDLFSLAELECDIEVYTSAPRFQGSVNNRPDTFPGRESKRKVRVPNTVIIFIKKDSPGTVSIAY